MVRMPTPDSIQDPAAVPSVLFVCLGNICRSPAAEGVFLHLLEKRGLLGRVRVDSAGTYGGHAGAPPDPRMTAAAQRRGIALAHRARQVTRGDLDAFDLVVAMDHANWHNLRHLHHEPKGRLHLLGEFLPNHHPTAGKAGHPPAAPEVPDPYYGGDAGFEQVLDMLEQASPLLLKRLLHG